jgi:hypothetical protein
MYGGTLVYDNSQGWRGGTVFKKEEDDWERVETVTVNGRSVDYLHHGGYLGFEAVIPRDQSAEIRIHYSAAQDLASKEEGINYHAKAVLRRYLSEFRDNYLSRHAYLHQGALRIKGALRL